MSTCLSSKPQDIILTDLTDKVSAAQTWDHWLLHLGVLPCPSHTAKRKRGLPAPVPWPRGHCPNPTHFHADAAAGVAQARNGPYDCRLGACDKSPTPIMHLNPGFPSHILHMALLSLPKKGHGNEQYSSPAPNSTSFEYSIQLCPRHRTLCVKRRPQA